MFKKILLCVDVSPAAENLVECVGEMKKLGVEEIVLAHVIYVANTPGLEAMLEDEAGPFLERHKTTLEAHGFRVTIEMPFGLPAHTIEELADKLDVSLIVIGSHGRSIIGEAILGRVSTKLLHLSRRPVLLLRRVLLDAGQCGSVCRGLFDRILFPTDFSESAERVIPYIAKVAVEMNCPVTLLHVLADKESDPVKKEQRENAERFLLEAKRHRLERGGANNITIDLDWGDPGQKICTKVTDGKFSLVVMGSGGKGVLKELLFGSVANEVARHSDVPVLFIPAIEHA